MSEATPPKGIEAWKVWSKQQIHSAFFLTEPDVSNTYRFDEELGVYLGFAGKEVIKQLENVAWDDEAQAPADKTKQQVYISMVHGPRRIQPHCVPLAPDLEALRIINNLRLPDDIVDSLTQAGWDPSKCCDPYSKGQERKLQPGSMVYNPRLTYSHFSPSCSSSDFELLYFSTALLLGLICLLRVRGY